MERAKWFFRTDKIEGLKERNDEEDGLSEEDQGSAVFFSIEDSFGGCQKSVNAGKRGSVIVGARLVMGKSIGVKRTGY